MFQKDDAVLTVGLRTNSGLLGLGYSKPLAQVEFYPNGGFKQPECPICKY